MVCGGLETKDKEKFAPYLTGDPNIEVDHVSGGLLANSHFELLPDLYTVCIIMFAHILGGNFFFLPPTSIGGKVMGVAG